VLLMAALGIGATVIAVPRALSGIVAVPQVIEPGISRTAAVATSIKPSTAKMPVWSAPAPTAVASTPDTRPPSTVSGLRLLSNNETTISLAWDPAQDNVAVKLYLVKGAGFTTVQTNDTKATVAWPRRTVSVIVQVCAVDASGNQGGWRNLLVTAPVGAAVVPTSTPTAPAVTTDPSVTTPVPDTSTATSVETTLPSATDSTGPTPAAVVTAGAPASTDPISAQPS
jgi:hypothetical protein